MQKTQRGRGREKKFGSLDGGGGRCKVLKFPKPVEDRRGRNKSRVQEDRNRKNVRSPGRSVGQPSTKNLAVLEYSVIELDNLADEKWADPEWREMHQHYLRAWWIDIAEKELSHLTVDERCKIIGISRDEYYRRKNLYNIPTGGTRHEED